MEYDLESDSRALVVTSDGQSFLAKHVLITTSAGFLKENVDSMFSPPLPQTFLTALDVSIKFINL